MTTEPEAIPADVLEPCPFCGGEAKYHPDHTTERTDTVSCSPCGFYISDDGQQGSCVARWNRRATLEPAPKPAGGEWVMVPVQATEEMIEAGESALKDYIDVYMDGSMVVVSGAVEAIYLAMQEDAPPAPAASPSGAGASFQDRVDDWLIACFGEEIARDKIERNHRFIEEALELVQSNGCTASEAHQLVDYVYGRPVGELEQEVGGVMNTLAALCLANGISMDECGETELCRVWTKIEKIRAKQAAKPKHLPLPEHVTSPEAPQASEVVRELAKVRRILTNSDLHETTRCVDAIDVIDAALAKIGGGHDK